MDAIEDTLVTVTASHFCASIVLADGACVRAAPILKWALGKEKAELSAYFRQKGWKATQRSCGPVVGEQLEKTDGHPES